MRYSQRHIRPGDNVVSPAGRKLLVRDIIVPRNARALQPKIPTQFRDSVRKIVIFENNTVTTLAEVNSLYTLLEDTIH